MYHFCVLETTDLNSVIIRVDRVTRKATVVSEFPTHGVSVLEVFYTEKGPHVVVGNTFDTTRGSSQVYLDIYRFNVLTEQVSFAYPWFCLFCYI